MEIAVAMLMAMDQQMAVDKKKLLDVRVTEEEEVVHHSKAVA